MHKIWRHAAVAAVCLIAYRAAAANLEQVSWGLGPVVVFNATDRPRTYVVRDSDLLVDLSRRFKLPPGSACRLDTGLYLSATAPGPGPNWFQPSHNRFLGHFVEDVSEGYRGVMNGPHLRDVSILSLVNIRNILDDRSDQDKVMHNTQELQTCSAAAQSRCAGDRWASWQVGLMVQQPYSTQYTCPGEFVGSAEACRIDFVPDRLYWPRPDWGSGGSGGWFDFSVASPSGLRFHRPWPTALLLIQGGLDGQGFDLHRYDQLPSSFAFDAPLCSTV